MSQGTGKVKYFEGTPIPGATGQTYYAIQPGWYWTLVTLDGCISEPSNHVQVISVDINEFFEGQKFVIYPVPNDGRFNISIELNREDNIKIRIYNGLGEMIYEISEVDVKGKYNELLDLRPLAEGIYSVVFSGNCWKAIRRFVSIKNNI